MFEQFRSVSYETVINKLNSDFPWTKFKLKKAINEFTTSDKKSLKLHFGSLKFSADPDDDNSDDSSDDGMSEDDEIIEFRPKEFQIEFDLNDREIYKYVFEQSNRGGHGRGANPNQPDQRLKFRCTEFIRRGVHDYVCWKNFQHEIVTVG